MGRLKVKVCGMTEAENVRQILNAGADYIGLIFHPGSPRYVGKIKEIPFPRACLEAAPVMVSVDMPKDGLVEEAHRLGFRILQLHGKETPEECRSLREAGFEVWKAFGISCGADLEKLESYEGTADKYVLDARTEKHGGSGKKFDWKILEDYKFRTPFMLSAGISEEDAPEILSLDIENMEGVDINSRFEIEPGFKDSRLVGKFIKMIKRMNRLTELLNNKRENILAVYFTAGYPRLDSTVDVISALCRGGADIIEIGIPFSDPMADGPVIQESGSKALENGMNLSLLLDQAKEAREKNPDTPFVAMGYLNPIMKMGAEQFFKRAKESGIDGVIIPDLPFAVYMEEYKMVSAKYGIPVIMLITPETSDERIHLIDDHCEGFIYMVSSASTTGARDSFTEGQKAYFRRIAGMNLKHPRLIGFGISNQGTYSEACECSSGAIIGSQFIKELKSSSTPVEAVSALMARIGRHSR